MNDPAFPLSYPHVVKAIEERHPPFANEVHTLSGIVEKLRNAHRQDPSCLRKEEGSIWAAYTLLGALTDDMRQQSAA